MSIVSNLFIFIFGHFVLDIDEMKNQKQRGAANGISMVGMSLFKAAGPTGGEFFSLNNFLVIFLLTIILYESSKLFVFLTISPIYSIFS